MRSAGFLISTLRKKSVRRLWISNREDILSISSSVSQSLLYKIGLPATHPSSDDVALALELEEEEEEEEVKRELSDLTFLAKVVDFLTTVEDLL